MGKLKPLFAVQGYRVGQIGAGTVVPFKTPSTKRWIPLPKNARAFDHFDEYEVSGDSLEGRRIFDGDILTCRRNFDISEITPNKICIVRILPTGEETAKMVEIDIDTETVTLRGANKSYIPRTFFIDEIEILAVAVEGRFGL